jgi:hypothetical protein
VNVDTSLRENQTKAIANVDAIGTEKITVGRTTVHKIEEIRAAAQDEADHWGNTKRKPREKATRVRGPKKRLAER